MKTKEFNLSEKIRTSFCDTCNREVTNLCKISDIKEFIKNILEEDIKNIEFEVYRKAEGKDVNVMKVSDFIRKFKKRAGDKLI